MRFSNFPTHIYIQEQFVQNFLPLLGEWTSRTKVAISYIRRWSVICGASEDSWAQTIESGYAGLTTGTPEIQNFHVAYVASRDIQVFLDSETSFGARKNDSRKGSWWRSWKTNSCEERPKGPEDIITKWEWELPSAPGELMTSNARGASLTSSRIHDLTTRRHHTGPHILSKAIVRCLSCLQLA